MSKTEIAKRYILFVLGLFFAAIGVAFTKHGELGVSPISSVADVLSCKFSAFSLGTWLIIWNCILIVGQIVVLRKKFQLIQLLQVPLSFIYSWNKRRYDHIGTAYRICCKDILEDCQETT